MNTISLFARTRIILISLAVQAVVCSLNYAAGEEMHMDIFYFLPVCICAWYLGRGEVVMSTVVGTATWGYVDTHIGEEYSSPLFFCWNLAVIFTSLLVVGLVLRWLRDSLRQTEQARQELSKALTGLQQSSLEIEKLRGQLQVVCAWTKRIRVEGKWLTFDEFLKNHLHLKLSHGIYPGAMEQFAREMEQLKPPPATETGSSGGIPSKIPSAQEVP